MRLFIRLIAALFLLLPPQHSEAEQPLRVLVMGDSLMTTNGSKGTAVPQLLQTTLNADVKSQATTGARFAYALPVTGALGFNIAKQWRQGSWDVVVMNGGGNDLWLGCGCGRCDRRLAKLISPSGDAGLIPSAVARARSSGAHVIYVGYLRSPGFGSPIESCKVWGDRLEMRLAIMANRSSGVTFLSLADMVPTGDRSFHAADRIHPSSKGSRAIAARIVSTIRAAR
ncbi:SGNH/GDSL hydrolase family protein [Sulfitobacter aestuariivivens]|uniref:SGNH/GDSL hydrolase family protein n=1 Tax=Sulfitobacter aestuariivivens TaxID=2766981 RepID=A0A927HH30_9RHOB|nr:SGNH/GDSL hydrolase family protein [Sulfitobacter aestuariivivens]MBD3664855.1 SGNH/GDSL hydrolase family protein [Sulfitobacter aestuariivivens]